MKFDKRGRMKYYCAGFYLACEDFGVRVDDTSPPAAHPPPLFF